MQELRLAAMPTRGFLPRCQPLEIMVFIWGSAAGGNHLSVKRRKIATDNGLGEKKVEG